ncbi:hypothetical protein TWF730_008751 [Orbilia blumenaviensis]|uniref:Uncharacterized protein n=1 Tax=Orbilia blumenaviensis TaxID=1796055 RepID=A0AAV9V3Z7_9PEZI
MIGSSRTAGSSPTTPCPPPPSTPTPTTPIVPASVSASRAPYIFSGARVSARISAQLVPSEVETAANSSLPSRPIGIFTSLDQPEVSSSPIQTPAIQAGSRLFLTNSQLAFSPRISPRSGSTSRPVWHSRQVDISSHEEFPTLAAVSQVKKPKRGFHKGKVERKDMEEDQQRIYIRENGGGGGGSSGVSIGAPGFNADMSEAEEETPKTLDINQASIKPHSVNTTSHHQLLSRPFSALLSQTFAFPLHPSSRTPPSSQTHSSSVNPSTPISNHLQTVNTASPYSNPRNSSLGIAVQVSQLASTPIHFRTRHLPLPAATNLQLHSSRASSSLLELPPTPTGARTSTPSIYRVESPQSQDKSQSESSGYFDLPTDPHSPPSKMSTEGRNKIRPRWSSSSEEVGRAMYNVLNNLNPLYLSDAFNKAARELGVKDPNSVLRASIVSRMDGIPDPHTLMWSGPCPAQTLFAEPVTPWEDFGPPNEQVFLSEEQLMKLDFAIHKLGPAGLRDTIEYVRYTCLRNLLAAWGEDDVNKIWRKYQTNGTNLFGGYPYSLSRKVQILMQHIEGAEQHITSQLNKRQFGSARGDAAGPSNRNPHGMTSSTDNKVQRTGRIQPKPKGRGAGKRSPGRKTTSPTAQTSTNVELSSESKSFVVVLQLGAIWNPEKYQWYVSSFEESEFAEMMRARHRVFEAGKAGKGIAQ